MESVPTVSVRRGGEWALAVSAGFGTMGVRRVCA